MRLRQVHGCGAMSCRGMFVSMFGLKRDLPASSIPPLHLCLGFQGKKLPGALLHQDINTLTKHLKSVTKTIGKLNQGNRKNVVGANPAKLCLIVRGGKLGNHIPTWEFRLHMGYPPPMGGGDPPLPVCLFGNKGRKPFTPRSEILEEKFVA